MTTISRISDLLRPGARVNAQVPDGIAFTGTIREVTDTPTPALLIDAEGRQEGPVVVFLGGGVFVRPAPPRHPAL